MAHSPIFVIVLVALSACVFTSAIILLSIIFYNVNQYMQNYTGVANTMIIIQAFVVLLGLASVTFPYIKMLKVIKAHQRNFNEVD